MDRFLYLLIVMSFAFCWCEHFILLRSEKLCSYCWRLFLQRCLQLQNLTWSWPIVSGRM